MYKLTNAATKKVRYFSSQIELESYLRVMYQHTDDITVDKLCLDQIPNDRTERTHQTNDGSSHRPSGG